MSDAVPGTLVQMRTMRRFQHYMAGEIIAVPIEAARDLEAKRLARATNLLVPGQPTPEPARQPTAGIIKK